MLKIKNFMRLFLSFQLVVLAFFLLNVNFAKAETIENITKEVKAFDDWTVVCDKDIMMNAVRCKIAAKFYNNTASVFVQPENKVANQVVFIIPNALQDTIVQVKVGSNDLVESDKVGLDNFAVIPMKESLKKKILEDMKLDNTYLYIRFYVRETKAIDGKKEVTERISLEKFNDMINYYYSQVKENKGKK